MRFAERARAAGGALLSARPAAVVAFGVAAQWLVTAVVALTATRSGGRYGPEDWSGDGSAGTLLVALDVLVLGPLALAAAYAFAAAVGGRALGVWTVAVWVTAPLALGALALAPYDPLVEERILPLALGLVPDLRFAAGVALTVAAALLVQIRSEQRRIVVAAVGVAVLAAVLTATGDDLSRAAFDGHMAGLREYFWSQRLLQWLPLAGVVAVARRSPGAALALGGWLGSFLILRGASPSAGLDGAELFRALLPALPAYVLLAAALPLLVPTLATRLGRHAAPVSRAVRPSA